MNIISKRSDKSKHPYSGYGIALGQVRGVLVMI